MAVKVQVRTEADVKALERYQSELDAARTALLRSGKSVGEFTREMRKLDSQQRALNNLTPQTTGHFSKLKDLFGGFVITGGDVVNALKTVGEFIWKVGVAGAEAKKAEDTLRFAVEKAGIAWQANAAAIDQNIQRTSWLAAVDDEELYVAQSKLVRSTQDLAESQKLLGLATDISALTGQDLNAVTKALSRAYAGNYSGLSRLGIAIDTTKGKTEAFKTLYEQFGGGAAYVNDNLISDADRMSIAWGNFKESVGEAVGPIVSRDLNEFSLALNLITSKTLSGAEKWDLYWEAFGGAKTKPEVIEEALYGVADATDGMTDAQYRAAQKTAELNAAMQEEYELLQDLPNVLSPAEQGALDLYEANLKVKKAQEDYNTAVKEFGADSDEARVAAIKLEEAKRRQTEQSGQWQEAINAENDRLDEQRRAAIKAADALGALATAKAKSGTGGNNIIVGRAGGGPVTGGVTYLVGEEGPELFTAPFSGGIIPAHQTQNILNGGPISVSVNVGGTNASAYDIAAEVERALKSAVRNSYALGRN